MTKDFKLLSPSIKLELADQLFDSYRFVDPFTKEVIASPELSNTEVKPKTHCYDVWENGIECENCISKKAFQHDKTHVKIVYQGTTVIQVTAVPIIHSGNKVILELMKDITDTGIFNIENKNEGLIYDVINDYNNKLDRDSLTGAYNGHYAFAMINKQIADANNSHRPLSLFFISVNNITKINILNGHDEGNKSLQLIYRIVNSFCADLSDFVARYHGLRFLLVLNNTSAKKAYQIAKRLNKKIESNRFLMNKKMMNHSVNIGFYTLENEDLTADQLVKKAQKNVFINNEVVEETMIEKKPLPSFNASLLSIREMEVAELMLKGVSNMEIANQLYLSEVTVKKHVGSIFKKMEVSSRAEFISKFSQKPV